MSIIVFYCNEQKENIKIFEYYAQDIKALEAIGHEVIVCTKLKEIPLKFDYIYIWWWTYALLPVLLGKLIGAKSIITGAFNFKFPDSFDGKDYFRRPFYQRVLINIAARLANYNVFINDFEERDCKAYFKLKNTYVSPCVVSEEYFSVDNNQRKNFLFNICWSGFDNLHRKGIPELLKAIKILNNRGVELTLKLAGKEGDGYNWLQSYIKDLAIENNVEMLGKISTEEKIQLLKECMIYVQPSHYEGFGLGIAEAMSSSCCVVTCDVGAVKTVVGDAGIYSNTNDPNDLADKIEYLLNDINARRKISSEAHLRALSNFSPSAKIELFKKILK